MTVRYSFRNQCQSKKAYPSYRRAALAAKSMARREKEEFSIYFCSGWCGRWHVGHVVEEAMER